MAFKQNVGLSLHDMPRDTHQMLLHELHRENREEALKTDLIGGRPVDQRVGASDQYLVLDGNERNTSFSDIKKGLFVFDIQNGTGTAAEIIGVHDELHTISEIEFQSFPMPNIKIHFIENLGRDDVQAPIGPNVCSTYLTPQQVFYSNQLYPSYPVLAKIPLIPLPGSIIPIDETSVNRFEIQIAETSLQSFPDKCGFRHNFAFDIVYLNNQAYANPVSPVFVFTDPIVSISRLSLTFFDAYRCSTLSFSPTHIHNVRIGAYAGVPLTSGRVPYYLNLFFESELPPFSLGNYIYISPTTAAGTPVVSNCFDPKIFSFIATCGINTRTDQNYPLVTHNVIPTVWTTLDGIRYWLAQFNPNIEYPIIEPTVTNDTPAAMYPLDTLTTSAEALAYGYTTFDPIREIIILVPNSTVAWNDPRSVVRCVGTNNFLVQYGGNIQYTIKIETCITTMWFKSALLNILIPPAAGVTYQGMYMLKNPIASIKKAPAINPAVDAIKLTSAKPFVNVKNTVDSLNFAKTDLLPNIDEITVCLPLNQLRIPVRVRRILRRITQLGGL